MVRTVKPETWGWEMKRSTDGAPGRQTIGLELLGYAARLQEQRRSYGKAQAQKHQPSRGAAGPVRKVEITPELRAKYER